MRIGGNVNKDTYYFPHDYNARTDEKLKQLFRKHGMLGYGIFWAIVEDLYNNANAMRTDYDGIAYDLRTECEIVKSVINDFNLFTFNGEYFGSLSIDRRLSERIGKSEKARKSASYRWNNKNCDANAMRTQCDSNARKEKKEKKEKKIYTSIFPFEDFWNQYDKKVGDKKKLSVKWEKLSENDKKNILEYIPKYKATKPKKQFRKNPEAFLNNQTWEDELIPNETPKNQPDKQTSSTPQSAIDAYNKAGIGIKQ